MKKAVIIAAVLIGLSLVYNFVLKNRETEPKAYKSLKIGEVILNIEVAHTDAARVKGLSGRESLGEDEGLLFIFDKEGYYAFWMKDMNFPIDIAWLDESKRIIYIEKDVSPDTYPHTFGPGSPALYVLETKAGFFENHGIKIGDRAEF